MEIYKVKTAKGRTFWSIQLPEADADEEVVGSQTVTEELLAEIPSIDKTYIILELLQIVRQENVERKAKEVAQKLENAKMKAKMKS